MQGRLAAVIGCGAVALALAGVAPRAHAIATPTSVTLAWTAPGDDSTSGTASLYDVRYATAPITLSNWVDAYAAAGAPTPQPAGSTDTMLVTGLTPATTYWFAIRTRDDAGNWSALSNVVQWTTASASDSIRPAPLVIAVGGTTASSVTLDWTAVGDDSLTGTATRYEVRWSNAAITAANWPAATVVAYGVPVPAAPGTAQACTVTGLDRTQNLYFAVRVADEVNNWSVISNVVTVAAQLDASPPATPTGLAVSVQSDGEHLRWNANTEPDLAGYHVYRALSATGPYTRLDASTLAAADFVDTTAPDSASVWYAVSAVDASNNESARSGAVRAWLHAAGITALRLQPAYPNPSTTSTTVTLPIDVPGTGPIDGRLDLYNGAGERVRSMALQGLAPGTNLVTWDGRNDAGRPTAPGVYRALLHAGGTDQVVRLVRQP